MQTNVCYISDSADQGVYRKTSTQLGSADKV